MLTGKAILALDDIGDSERVEVPEWGGYVFVKIMSGLERDKWELFSTQSMAPKADVNIRASLCAMVICDDKGVRLFSDAQIGELGKKSAIPLDRIFAVAKRVNKLADSDLDELEKNSGAATRGASGSS